MDQNYQVVYQGRLARGQTRSQVAARLSQALGRDAPSLERLLDGPERVILTTASESEARRLMDIFSQAGAEMRFDGPTGKEQEGKSRSKKKDPKEKTSVKPSFGQRVWLARAAGVLLVLALVTALGFSLLLASLFALVWSYSWVLGFVPFPQVLFPLYAIVFLALLVAIVALAKPFVPIRAHRPRSIRLESDNEPDLFDFIEHVCDVIRVPMPKSVFMDMSGSVSAGWRRGSEVTIGLPVIASMTATEVGGMLARALTLHAGGISGALGRFVSGIVGIFQNAVQGRDLVDQWLHRSAQGKNRPLAYLARSVSWLLALSRRVLGYLLKEAIGTSAAAMQSIESHMDRHQARFIGTARFDKSLRLARTVRFAADRTDAALRDSWRKREPLTADITSAVTQRLQTLAKPDTFSKVITLAESEQERVPQFHLPDVKRIERIAKSGIVPALACGNPARVLMKGAPVLSRRLTILHYRNSLHLPVTPARLQARPSPDQAALDRISGTAYLDLLPLGPRRFIPKNKPMSELIARARKFGQAIPGMGENARKANARYREVEQLLQDALFQELVLRSNRISTRWTRAKLEEMQTRCRSLEDSLEKAFAALTPHGDLISQRLANGIAMLEQPETASRIPRAQALAAEAVACSEALDKLQQQTITLRELLSHASLLELLLAESKGGLGDMRNMLKDRISEQEADINNGLTALKVALMRAPYPLEKRTSLFDASLAGWVPTNPRYEVLDEVNAVVDGLWRLKGKIVVRLASITDAVEGAWLGHAQFQ